MIEMQILLLHVMAHFLASTSERGYIYYIYITAAAAAATTMENLMKNHPDESTLIFYYRFFETPSSTSM